MPASNFANGTKGVMKVGTTTPVSLPTGKWDLTIKSNARDVSNTRDGRKRIPGLQDAEGSFDLPFDAAADPVLAANGGLVAGAVVQLSLYTDGGTANPYTLSAIIDEIGLATEIEGEIHFPVKYSLESGTVTLPTA